MIINNLKEAEQIETELRKDILYSVFFRQWSIDWFEFVKKNDKKGWNWKILTENINVSFEVIKDNIEYPWSNGHICENENITYDNVVEMIEKNIKFYGNPADIMFENMNTILSSVRNMNNEDNANIEDDTNPPVYVISGLDINMSAGNINIDIFSKNKNFTTELIEKNPKNIPIDYHFLSLNPNLSQEYFIKNIEKDWNMWSISGNPFITFDFVLQHPHLEWDYDNLSQNKSITWDIIKKNQDKPWDYHAFMWNPNCTLDIILENPDKNWDIEFFKKHILNRNSNSGDLYASMLESNPMITWNDIYKYEKEGEREVSYSALSMHKFTGMRVNWIYHQMKKRKEIYEKLHQELIQKTWAPHRFMNWCLDYEEFKDLSQK